MLSNQQTCKRITDKTAPKHQQSFEVEGESEIVQDLRQNFGLMVKLLRY